MEIPPEDKTLKLGGNIELSGFREIDLRSMIILKKIIGNYVRKFTDHFKGFKSIKVHLKPIAKKLGSEQFELQASLLIGKKIHNAESIDRNIFIAVDSLFKKLDKELAKK